MKIVINADYGGYSLSPKALLWLYEKGFRDNVSSLQKWYGENYLKEFNYKDDFLQFENYKLGLDHDKHSITVFSPDGQSVLNSRPDDRSHPLIVECVETIGSEANGPCAKLSVVEIPDDVEWILQGHHGCEHIAEKHRTWHG